MCLCLQHLSEIVNIHRIEGLYLTERNVIERQPGNVLEQLLRHGCGTSLCSKMVLIRSELVVFLYK